MLPRERHYMMIICIAVTKPGCICQVSSIAAWVYS
jgi:hypothetical protein